MVVPFSGRIHSRKRSPSGASDKEASRNPRVESKGSNTDLGTNIGANGVCNRQQQRRRQQRRRKQRRQRKRRSKFSPTGIRRRGWKHRNHPGQVHCRPLGESVVLGSSQRRPVPDSSVAPRKGTETGCEGRKGIRQGSRRNPCRDRGIHGTDRCQPGAKGSGCLQESRPRLGDHGAPRCHRGQGRVRLVTERSRPARRDTR
mmetsp:Transcript_1941/g.4269  ORF Transcript_1941/g.4269 Transcript_1941/m.4269 type:complete len:201 (-) Transcript_1941:737-1339(-)